MAAIERYRPFELKAAIVKQSKHIYTASRDSCVGGNRLATRIERRHYKYLKATSKRMVMGPFDCPQCGTELYFQRDDNKVKTKCQCGLTGEWPYGEILQPVDYYNKLTDELRGKRNTS